MKTRLLHFWDSLLSSLWFIPSLMVLASLALSWLTITLDGGLGEGRVDRADWIWAGGSEGARQILSTIAGSMITVAGVVFSITVVVLALASSQFGPRLLRNFMRDTGNQVVLGTFIATFTYCLVVLRTIRTGGEEFVPHVSVTVALAFALVSLGVLIYFIHHVSSSIQAPIAIVKVARELESAIDLIFPEELGRDPQELRAESERLALAAFDDDAVPVPSAGSGYVQAIDAEGLMDLATEKDLIVRLCYRPGQFVVEGSELAQVRSKEPLDASIVDRINVIFILGPQRTEEQDVEFSLHQLVEIAVRALSPGINDPFTAINCIDWLSVAMCRVAGRRMPSPFRYDAEGNPRVIAEGPTFAGIVQAAVGPIRQYGRSSAPVAIRLLEGLAQVVLQARRIEDRRALLAEAETIVAGSRDALPSERDRKDVQERYRRVLRSWNRAGTVCRARQAFDRVE